MVHVLRTERYSIGLLPEAGGRVEWLRMCHQGSDYDILRPRPETGADQGRIPLYGNFAMLPFCNRLLPMEMQTSDGAVAVAMNWPAESCAIHGLGCEAAWSLDGDATDRSCNMSCRIVTADGVDLGAGLQQVSVSDETGLTHRVGFRNEVFDWILTGVGFHPWFYMPETGARLEFRAKGRFIADSALYPQRYEELENPVQHLGPNTHEGLDQCFAGWTGSATVHLPHLPVPVALESDAPNLHVYVNSDLQAICAEPQTHVTNATHDHRWDDFAGMVKLTRGATLWLQYRIGTVADDRVMRSGVQASADALGQTA